MNPKGPQTTPQDTPKWLGTFCAVVEAGSLNLAAERLHLSQPAISKQLQTLEAQLGATLLLRTPKGVTLTPIGRRVHHLARRSVAAARECLRVAADWPDTTKGHITVSAGLTLALYTLPPIIKVFRSRAPGVHLELLTGDSQQCLARLLDFEADVALVTSPLAHPEVQTIPLFFDPLVAVGAPGSRMPHSLADLAGAPLITFKAGSGFRQYLDHILESRDIRTESTMEFDSVEAIQTMVELGLGVALLPWSAVKAQVAAGALESSTLADWPDKGRHISLLRRRAGLRSGPAGLFATIARAMLDSLNGEALS